MKDGPCDRAVLVGRIRPVSLGVGALALVMANEVARSDQPLPEQASEKVLLTDSLGRVVSVPAADVPAKLLPPPAKGLANQVPQPVKGVPQPDEVRRRNDAARPAGFHLFPSVQPPLMSYLASQDELGNTAIAPGPLVDVFLLEPEVQGAKYRASDVGFRYQLEQTFSGTGVSGPAPDSGAMGYYTLKIVSKWAVYADASTAGWLSAEVHAQAGLGNASESATPQADVGSLTNPSQTVSRRNGFRFPELAWQQSFRRGEVVVLAGVIDQGNYLDANSYANSGRGQFLNSALVNSMVLPLPSYDFGLNLQWQPGRSWYAMLGLSAGAAGAGETPWKDFSWSQWSAEAEFGWMPDDLFGLGPGIYRIQPFLARAGGPTQGGIGFNIQQQLGRHSPVGWFGRFGVGGMAVSGGASTQIGSGLVLQAPLEKLGWIPRLTNDVFGAGFVWSQPSATTKTVYHRNEYVFEAFYTLRFSRATRIQPDVQVVWNPVFNPDPGPAVVFQAQMIVSW